jgi:hypothetical protein
MAVDKQMTDAQFDERIIGILQRELDVAEFARYMNLHRTGKGDYTAERHLWLDKLTLDEVFPQLTPGDSQQKG